MGESERAKEILTQVIQRNPQNSDALVQMSNVLGLQAKHSQVIGDNSAILSAELGDNEFHKITNQYHINMILNPNKKNVFIFTTLRV